MNVLYSLAGILGALSLVGCGQKPPALATSTVSTIAELQSIDQIVGTGPAIADGQTAVVHYTGWLYEPGAQDQKGKQFDSSRERGVPFRFKIGAQSVIKGWEQGIVGMQVGGQRRLIIPPHLGYGERSAGPIPRNSTLLFDIELLAIE